MLQATTMCLSADRLECLDLFLDYLPKALVWFLGCRLENNNSGIFQQQFRHFLFLVSYRTVPRLLGPVHFDFCVIVRGHTKVCIDPVRIIASKCPWEFFPGRRAKTVVT